MRTLHNQQRHRKWCVWIFRERRSVYNASTLYRGVTYQTEFDGDLFIMQQIRHRAGLRSGRFLHFLCVSCLLCFYAEPSTTPLEGLLQHFLLLWFRCMPNSPPISRPLLPPDQAEKLPEQKRESIQQIQNRHMLQTETSSVEHDQERDIIVVAVLELA